MLRFQLDRLPFVYTTWILDSVAAGFCLSCECYIASETKIAIVAAVKVQASSKLFTLEKVNRATANSIPDQKDLPPLRSDLSSCLGAAKQTAERASGLAIEGGSAFTCLLQHMRSASIASPFAPVATVQGWGLEAWRPQGWSSRDWGKEGVWLEPFDRASAYRSLLKLYPSSAARCVQVYVRHLCRTIHSSATKWRNPISSDGRFKETQVALIVTRFFLLDDIRLCMRASNQARHQVKT
jgi:hypothetical protein